MTQLTNPQRLIHARERLAVARRILFLVEKDNRVPSSEVRAAAKQVIRCIVKLRDVQGQRTPPGATVTEWREIFHALRLAERPRKFFSESGTIDPAAFAKLPKGRINAP